MFLPTRKEEMASLGWDGLDVILVTGDAYIDSPHIGVAVVGKVLLKAGYRVGVISQPDIRSSTDIMRLGEPALYWGITGGSIDSMVANYTPLRKRRKSDDYTPGGLNTKRPDRAVIVYANLIRRYSRENKPIVLGGIEASLRRIAHYDFWSDGIRRSILFDAKADVLVYGMGEYPVAELAKRMSRKEDFRDMQGICYISREKPDGFEELPSFEQVL
ncbi:MAG TPA: YgiQ family radical SAM protein, partial [Desulfomonilia bacterium]|nr:YgiQ family radical SAM protein [Desulfomonilia bacterium]